MRRIVRLVRQQVVDLPQGMLGPVGPVQHQRVVLPGGQEVRRQFHATGEQGLGVFAAPYARSDFGQHADRGHVGGRALQVRAQQGFRLGNAVVGQGGGGLHQSGIARGMAGVFQVGLRRAVAVPHRGQVVAELAPRLRQVRLQRQRTAQGRHRVAAASGAAERQAMLQMGQWPLRVFADQGLQHIECVRHLPAHTVRGGQHQQRHRMPADHADDLVGLLCGHRGVGGQQVARMVQRGFQRAGGRGGRCHAPTPCMGSVVRPQSSSGRSNRSFRQWWCALAFNL